MERKYSLRTCAIIILIAVIISWAPFVALWLWLKPSGGLSMRDMPPKEYRGDARMHIHFTRHSEVLCAIVKADPGAIACAGIGGDWAIAPNPCDWRDGFAILLCHEKGHNLGYPADHGR